MFFWLPDKVNELKNWKAELMAIQCAKGKDLISSARVSMTRIQATR